MWPSLSFGFVGLGPIRDYGYKYMIKQRWLGERCFVVGHLAANGQQRRKVYNAPKFFFHDDEEFERMLWSRIGEGRLKKDLRRKQAGLQCL